MSNVQSLENKKDLELWSIFKKSAHRPVDWKRMASLLRRGADVNKLSNRWTILLWVCWKNQNDSLPKLIRILVEYGANVNETDANGNRALYILCRFNQSPNLIYSIKALVDGKVDVNQTDRRRWNVLHYLARFNQSKELYHTMELLLNNGANVQATDVEGWNVLFYLARFYQGTDLINFFYLMIHHKINLEVRDLEGWNVVHVLCRYYCQVGKLQPIFQLLVENGVNIHCRTYKNLHALELMLFNPSGDFHSTCVWVMCHRRTDWDNLVWNDESVLNMAKLGCQEWTNYFSAVKVYRCEDDKGKAAVDYLSEVYLNSTPLCPQCRPKWQFDKFFIYNPNGSDVENNTKPIRRVKFPTFIPSEQEKLVSLRSCSIVSTEHDLKPVPEPNNWRWMANAWQKDQLSLDEVEFYLSEHSHWHCLHFCRWCTIFGHVHSYLNSLMDGIRVLDNRFESGPLIQYGSWAERSDILAANEFDFGIPLKHFSALTPETDNDADATVVFTKNEGEADAFYTDYGVSSGRLLLYYKFLVQEASSRIWNVRFFHPVVSLSETCVTLTFIYRGNREKPLKISVDLTLVVNMTSDSFQNIGAPHLPDVLCKLNAQQNENTTTRHLVPHRRNERGRWKVSHFAMEREVFLHQSCFPDVSQVLRLLKFFVLMSNHRRNPHRDGVEHTIQRKTSPSSYALKTCLFHYMKSYRPPWDPTDRIHHCIGVLRVFLAQGSQIKSFFAKNVVACDISYDSTLIVKEILKKLEVMKNQSGVTYVHTFDQDIFL